MTSSSTRRRWCRGVAGGAVGLGLAGCSGTQLINAFVPRSTYVLREGLPYGEDPRQRLDLYLPEQPRPPGGHPVVLFFYGGSWNSGERASYRFVGEALAARGIAVALADYRLYPQVRYPAFLEDGAMACAWLRQHAAAHGLDLHRFTIGGHSAGAYNAAMLVMDARWLAGVKLTPSVFNAWFGLAGPYDFIPIENPDVKPVFFHPNEPPDSQPMAHVRAGLPPTFLAVGGKDDLVDPKRNTLAMAEALQRQGVAVTLKVYERTSHVSLLGAVAPPLRFLAPVLDDLSAFILAAPPVSPA